MAIRSGIDLALAACALKPGKVRPESYADALSRTGAYLTKLSLIRLGTLYPATRQIAIKAYRDDFTFLRRHGDHIKLGAIDDAVNTVIAGLDIPCLRDIALENFPLVLNAAMGMLFSEAPSEVFLHRLVGAGLRNKKCQQQVIDFLSKEFADAGTEERLIAKFIALQPYLSIITRPSNLKLLQKLLSNVPPEDFYRLANALQDDPSLRKMVRDIFQKRAATEPVSIVTIENIAHPALMPVLFAPKVRPSIRRRPPLVRSSR